MPGTLILPSADPGGVPFPPLPPIPFGWQTSPGGRAWAISANHARSAPDSVWELCGRLAIRGIGAYPEVVIEPARGYAGKRWDLAVPAAELLVEVQGGGFNGGKHGRGAGLLDDYAKANLAARLGWRCMYLVPRDLTVKGGARALAAVLDVLAVAL